MPDLSIVILSYNTADITLDCLKSIIKHTKGIDYEIIVVDNHSSDDSVLKITHYKKGKPIKLVTSTKNLGFAAGNNLGATKASGEFLLFLNSDTLFTNNVLKKVLATAQQKPNLGALSVRLKNKDGSTQATGGFFPTLLNVAAWQLFIDDLPLLNRLVKPIHPKPEFYSRSITLDWLTGAFMLIPQKVFTQVKGFDPAYFMYVEDAELCFRLHQLNLRCYYLADLSIVHLGGASSPSGYALLNEAKNISHFFKTHYSPLHVFLVTLLIRLGSLLRLVLFGIIKFDVQKAKIYFQILTARLTA